MNVQIYSREEIEKLIAEGKFPENTAVISFCDSGTEPRERVNYSGACSRIMYIELDDLELDELSGKGYTYDTLFPEADEAAEFIIDAYNSGMNIICQCEYGQSRSAGCAAAVKEHFVYDGISLFADHRYYPNKVVYHKIFDALKAYKEKHPEANKFEIDKCIRLLKYNGTDENVVIPEGVNLICYNAFDNSTVKSVKIPDSVREIEDMAFYRCGTLEQINIPSSAARIDRLTFFGCKNLEFIEIPPDVYIDQDVFAGTKWKQNYPGDFIVVNGVLIGYKGEQSKVVIPDNVREIGCGAFGFSENLKEIIIPKTVEVIGELAFANCENLKFITLDNPNLEIGEGSFDDCPNVKQIICCGRSVLTYSSRDDHNDFTKTVSNILAFVRQKNEHK